MESKYDRVAYPENVYLHSDGEMEDFGTGVYPVQRRPYRDDSTFKVACIKVKRRFRLFAVVGVLILVLLIIAIAVIATAAVSRQSGDNKSKKLIYNSNYNSNDKKYGLYFYPRVDYTSLIEFNPRSFQTFKKYSDALEFAIHDYNTISVNSQKDKFVECTNSSGPPEGKECKMDANVFGIECTHLREYGYNQGRPCILLKLKLMPGTTPVPFGKQASSVVQLLGDHWSPDHVGITCDGEDEESRKHMRHNISKLYHDNKDRNEDLIDFLPPKGFPVAFFVRKTQTVIPAVMVHFNDILNNALVKIQCVAWAESFNNGQPQSSPMYTAKFQFYIK